MRSHRTLVFFRISAMLICNNGNKMFHTRCYISRKAMSSKFKAGGVLVRFWS